MLPVWLEAVGGKYHTSKSRDIAWRSRGQRSPEMLTRIIRDSSTTLEDLPRFLRAFDFLSGPEKEAALIQLAFATNSDNARRQSFIVAEALNRLPNLDINGNPKYKTALNKVLDASRGSQQFVRLVSKFSLRERYPELLAIAQEHPAEQIGVEAIRALLSKNARPLIIAALSSKDAKISTATAAALGNSADGRSSKLLMAIVSDSNRTIELRRQAVRGVAKTKNGASSLLAMARTKRLDQDLIDAAAASLHTAQWRDIKEQAIKLFPLPPAKDSKPLPPVAQLLKRRGNVALGKIVFAKTGTCAKCHKVGGEGKDVGPNLTEIGDKLSRQAFFESVLYPNAGISHNYETYAVQLEDGNTVTGVKTSETPDSITIKSADAIERTIKKVQIEEIVKQKVSLMPADLQKLMTAEDLINVVEYLATLKKRK
jgi:putative heme-binding domain-containing protein